jgi:predicted nucleic acid-binding protein
LKIAFDSNLLIYLARVWKIEDDRDKSVRLDSLLRSLDSAVRIVVPFQALGEAYRVMLRFGYSRLRCRDAFLDWAATFEPVASSDTAFVAAVDLAAEHSFQFWDALIVNVAADAGCKLLLSEDMQSGFVWRGMTVVNPLATPMDERLSRLLNAPE